MNPSRKQQSLQKSKTQNIQIVKMHIRSKHQEKTYSKAIHPSNLQTKPFSLKNLDLALPDNSISQSNTSFQDDKSCCCIDCGNLSKKVKNLQKKFTVFRTEMSILKRQRLVKRFQNAVRCIIFLKEKWKKIRQQERAKRLFRFKTKVFENQPFFQTQSPSNQAQLLFLNSQLQSEEKQAINTQLQSIQVKIFDQKNKQRQSVKLYLQQKLNNKNDVQGLLPKLDHNRQNVSISSSIFRPIRILKTLGDEKKSLQKEQNLSTQNPSVAQSPYLSHLTHLSGNKQQDSQFQIIRSPRQVIKSFASETFFPQSTQKNDQRKLIAQKLKRID
ncbi:unnamed protein product (macronuclear) [Paramecium tetraurelia]|uniref:Uncharacterized protein n=1 Tax=Paramecium tetraurelia TaxID=5888 RepID=A0D6X6_PARTE|nr:uncharacterized protein GSPATT00001834001 [Paramecium tetraurelia]CAK78793.1 unnamed protein product [Paramecium tetraurelia]|eukprot:XP_001446190.1 hypothetical protein (macronuclear) [Paramecium tetraurelia strain d4-2]